MALYDELLATVNSGPGFYADSALLATVNVNQLEIAESYYNSDIHFTGTRFVEYR